MQLPMGDYLIFVKPMWKACHTHRTIVASIATSVHIDIKRVFYKKFSYSVLRMMEEWLEERMILGKDYEREQLEDVTPIKLR